MRLNPTAVIVLLIVYGSLYPFDFQAPHDASLAIASFLSDWSLWTSKGDVLGNIGLFMPFGLAAIWSAGGARSRLVAAGNTLAAGLCLAFAIQVAQLWVASRSGVLSDVAWNGVGILFGIVAGFALAAPRVSRHLTLGLTEVAALGLLLAWVTGELAPFVPSLDFGGIKASARRLLLRPSFDPVTAFSNVASVLLASRLVLSVTGPERSALALAALAAAILAGRVFAVERYLDWTMLGGVSAGLLAWFVWSRGGRRPIPSGALLVVVLAAYTLQALTPFVVGSPSTFSWIPFAASLEGAMLPNLRALSLAAFALGGCLWLARDVGWRPLPAACGLALWALALEIAQIWIEGRTPSVTEPVLVLLGGWLFWRADRSVGAPGWRRE